LTEADIAEESSTMDEREELHTDEGGTVKLQLPPTMILFKPEHETTIRSLDIELGLISLTPSEARYMVEAENGNTYRVL
jgi:hypothetical protein